MSDNVKKTLMVALGVCLVAAVLVSTAAVELKPIQTKNKKLDLLKNILSAGDLLKEEGNIEEIYQENIKPEIVDLETGEVIPESQYDEIVNVNDFDIKAVASSDKWGKAIPSNKDIAGIKRMPKVMIVYKVLDKDKNVVKYILPVYGKGLWSTMYGFISLAKDLSTVEGFTFYDQGETPGLGGEVDNPKWKKLWVGKKVYDQNGALKIEVIKRKVDPSSPNAKYQIDGLSGATLTTNGVNYLVRFWMSDEGYGGFLKKLRGENSNEKV